MMDDAETRIAVAFRSTPPGFVSHSYHKNVLPNFVVQSSLALAFKVRLDGHPQSRKVNRLVHYACDINQPLASRHNTLWLFITHCFEAPEP